MQFDLLRDIASNSIRFRRSVDQLFYAVIHHLIGFSELRDEAEALADRFNLSVELHDGPVLVFTSRRTRAKQPACIAVTINTATCSPSAVLYVHLAHASIQVFEAKADDTDVAGDRPDNSNRVVAQGRTLCL